MPDQTDATFEERLVSATDAYLDQLENCVRLLPRVVAAYAAGDDEAFEAVVERVRRLESDCDESVRAVTALVANADVRDLGIQLTHVHLHAGQTIELYQSLDEVANAAERFAEDLAATAPPRIPVLLDAFEAMGERACEAFAAMRAVVTSYLGVIRSPDAGVDITDAVERVRAAESDCDRHRNEAVSAAFSDHEDAYPVVYREQAWLLDGVVDAMEDVTDCVVRVSGSEVGIEVAPAAGGR
ncbi:DUF47 domain-containing protein [Halobacterium jilantaiense]|uniref:Phosphate transport system protein n=1 Tax=Halobacterium jilantaiense TaxID=355548 RepID=A0A1I0NS18_9EURY|nr:hypothetical protein [Halobacterium jilantaiense]SEW04424.1 hypothetical protein SAMN04487945_1106 [Halobacterium jilantaiense]